MNTAPWLVDGADMSGSRAKRILIWLPVAAAWAVVVLASVRALGTEDLGYHLAYGRQLLDGGGLVDHHTDLYTVPAPDVLTDPDAARPEPGPGCWYDAQGRYRFANANWASQAIIALVHRMAGIGGLNGLLIALGAGLFAGLALLMHRLDVAPRVIAAALLLLVGQACLLARLWSEGRTGAPLPWRTVAGLIALQAVLVNLHSYFFLGIAMTGAVLVGTAAARGVTDRREHLRRLLAACGGQVIVCLLNPWGWRLVVLPLQTALFLRRHGIADGPGSHPWSAMGDMQRTGVLDAGGAGPLVALGFVGALGIVAAGAAAAAQRRRWDWLLLMAGMTLVAFTAQRNLAVGMLIAVPFALAAVKTPPWWTTWWGRPDPTLARRGVGAALRHGPPIVIAMLAVTLGGAIVTNRLYLYQDSPIRFGAGLSRFTLPVGAADWLTRHPPTGRIWSAPVASSTLYGFIEPRPELNLITNTWAYPPDVMRAVLEAGGTWGPRPFAPTADAHGITVVVTRPGPLLRQLAQESDWVPVHLEGQFVVLVRRGGADAQLAVGFRLDPAALPLPALIETTEHLDADAAVALTQTARILSDLGWYGQALEVLAAARRRDAREPRAWIETANVFTRRMTTRDPGDLVGVRDDLRQIEYALGHAWRLTGDPQLEADLRAIAARGRQVRDLEAITAVPPAVAPDGGTSR